MNRNIFLDCGGHKAESIKLFLGVYPGSKEFEIHSFEPNPYFEKYYKEYENMITYHKDAVWIENSEKEFYVDSNVNEYGSTLLSNKVSGILNKKVKVRAIDFAKFIVDNFDQDDFILLKLDIEGAEYEVLPHMFETGAMKYVNVVYIEFHGGKLAPKKLNDTELIQEMENFGVIVYNGAHIWNPITNQIKGVNF